MGISKIKRDKVCEPTVSLCQEMQLAKHRLGTVVLSRKLPSMFFVYLSFLREGDVIAIVLRHTAGAWFALVHTDSQFDYRIDSIHLTNRFGFSKNRTG